MNTALLWLYQQHHTEPPTVGDEHCYLCGASCEATHLVERGIADTFNSHYLAQSPHSRYLCDACSWYLDNSGVHPAFLKMSIIVSPDAWRNWQRDTMKQDITQWLTFGLEQESYLVVSLTKKKHILMQAKLNAASSRTLALQVEENVAHLEWWHWKTMDAAFMRLLALGHNKGEILSGSLYGQTLRRHGHLMEAMQLNQELEPYRTSPEIELLSYVTIVDYGKGESDDGTSGRDTDPVSAGIGGQADSVHPPRSGVEKHRRGVQEQVPRGDMAAIRGETGDGGADYAQLDLFSE